MADRQAMMVGDKCWAWWEVILMQMRNDGVMEESKGGHRQPSQHAGGVSQCLIVNPGFNTSLCSHLSKLRILLVKSHIEVGLGEPSMWEIAIVAAPTDVSSC